jgi:hypothetical protein
MLHEVTRKWTHGSLSSSGGNISPKSAAVRILFLPLRYQKMNSEVTLGEQFSKTSNTSNRKCSMKLPENGLEFAQ